MAIDDFATGMASLKYLHQLPFDYLKIDRSFVNDLEDDPQGRNIARMVIDLAHDLGCEVIAEGVETPAQQAWLVERGCQLAQGWHFGRPVALAEFIDRAHAAMAGA